MLTYIYTFQGQAYTLTHTNIHTLEDRAYMQTHLKGVLTSTHLKAVHTYAHKHAHRKHT